MYSIRPVFRYPLFKVGEVPEGGRLTVDGLGVWVANSGHLFSRTHMSGRRRA